MSEIAIELCRVSKNYKLYEKPSDRVKEVFSLTGKKYSREMSPTYSSFTVITT